MINWILNNIINEICTLINNNSWPNWITIYSYGNFTLKPYHWQKTQICYLTNNDEIYVACKPLLKLFTLWWCSFFQCVSIIMMCRQSASQTFQFAFELTLLLLLTVKHLWTWNSKSQSGDLCFYATIFNLFPFWLTLVNPNKMFRLLHRLGM